MVTARKRLLLPWLRPVNIFVTMATAKKHSCHQWLQQLNIAATLVTTVTARLPLLQPALAIVHVVTMVTASKH